MNTYLYRHIRKDTNQVFYVGVGTGRNYERANTKFGRNPIWHNIVNKTDYEVEIMLDELDREFALEKEREFISLYGRIDLGTGTLSNLTDGGDGCVGFSDEVKRKMSEAQKGNQKWKLRKSNEHTRRMGWANKGRRVSEETKRAISQSLSGERNYMYGKSLSEETKKKLSEARKKSLAQYELDGTFVREYSCAADTVQYGFSASNVAKCCRGTMNKHRGYTFKYINQ